MGLLLANLHLHLLIRGAHCRQTEGPAHHTSRTSHRSDASASDATTNRYPDNRQWRRDAGFCGRETPSSIPWPSAPQVQSRKTVKTFPIAGRSTPIYIFCPRLEPLRLLHFAFDTGTAPSHTEPGDMRSC
jgi:hypothetical protein